MRVLVRVVLAVAAAAVLTASGPAGAQDPGQQPDAAIADGSAQRALDDARTRWRAAGPRSYRMRVRTQCFCPPDATRPRTVVVRGGRIVHAAREVRRFATVPRLFAIVQEAIRGKATILDVTYDRRRGFPSRIFIDRSLLIADEEAGYGAWAFRAL